MSEFNNDNLNNYSDEGEDIMSNVNVYEDNTNKDHYM